MTPPVPPEWVETVAEEAGLAFWEADATFSRFRYLGPGFRLIWAAPVEPLYRDATPFTESIVDDPAAFRAGSPSWADRTGPWSNEMLIHRDGEQRWLRVRGCALRGDDGTIVCHAGLVRDVTAQRRAEQEKTAMADELAALFRALPDVVLVLDDEGRYLRIASGDSRQLYRPESELTGRTVHEVLPADTADRFLAQIRATLERREPVNFQYLLEMADGRTEWFDAIVVPMGSRKVLWVARTLTDRVQLEQQLAHVGKLDALGKLAGGIAHDFNNVMTVIRGTSALMAEEIEDPGLLADLADIRESVERASSLTRQLLAFSRQQVLKPERVVVAEVIERMGRMLSRVIGEEIELSIVIDPPPGAVHIDPGSLEQIVANLVVNARHAITGHGEILIEVRTVAPGDAEYRAHEGSLTAAPQVLVRVRDTGAGMTAAVRERAFEPFYTTKRPGEGSGLGLSMVYGTVRQSGGHITIESEPGEGTSVCVYLPLAADEPTEPTPAEPAPVPSRPLSVLVVEDQAPVRKVVRRFLENAGHRVVEAANGVEALSQAEDAGELDVVLTDVVMPRMGGRELIHRLRESRPELPVVLMSGYAGDQLTEGRSWLESETLITKPFTRSTLLRAIHSAVHSSGETL